MAEALKSVPPAVSEESRRCLNCGEELLGAFCSHCGQEDLNLHRPLRGLLSDLVGEIFSLDTRLLRTLRPLALRPGELTRLYLDGHRVPHVPPLKTYLIAALIFFGLVAILPKGKVSVLTKSSSASSTPATRGSGVQISLPEHFPIFDRQLQAASLNAKAHPEEFADAVFTNMPRVFFLLVPAFAFLLEIFYRRAFYLDHLVFALHYHAFVFLDLSLLLLAGRPWVPRLITWPLNLLLIGWLLAYLPIALRRVYGGSRIRTFLKLVGLGILYLAAFSGGMFVLVTTTLWLF
jgi:hypothetical protein